MTLLLEKGERGLLVGQTGSGKSCNALYQLSNPCIFPVIIFDTKIEDIFFDLQNDMDNIDLIDSGIKTFEGYTKRKKKDIPAYMIVRPDIHEVQDYDILSDYCMLVYNNFGPCFVYFDELYNWHNNGRPTNGMIALYTRGRSKGKTVLGATQRPSWISRFCLTEAQKFYVHDLIDNRDRKTLAEVIPNYQDSEDLEKYHFHFFETGTKSTRIFSPVPRLEHNPNTLTGLKWL